MRFTTGTFKVDDKYIQNRQYFNSYNIVNSELTRNVFKKDKRRWNKKGKKYNTRLSTCT